MPLVRFPTPAGLVYTIDLTKIADRANPRTVEAPIHSGGNFPEPITVDWGDGTVEVLTNGGGTGWNTHTYAEGAGDVFTVVIRSATGKLPYVRFARLLTSAGQDYPNPLYSITKAVTSVDHFAGVSTVSSSSAGTGGSMFKEASNCKYVDPRLVGQNDYTSLRLCFTRAGIEQPLESFCFDFMQYLDNIVSVFFSVKATTIPGDLFAQNSGITYANGAFAYNTAIQTIGADLFKNCVNLEDAGNVFSGCTALTAIPATIFDNCPKINTIANAFRTCSAVTGEPYIFWKEDGSIDTDKFPNLTADNAANCYSGCSAALRAQVPEAYGGTMTV